MASYYLGIDIGTFSSRGILLDDNFKIIADCSTPHGMENPKPNYFEHDAEEVWWKDFCILSHRLIEESGIDPKDIRCVGSSALGTDCLPVDENCRPLRKAILYGIDARAENEIKYLSEYYGPEKVDQLFGHPINSGDTATKILWIRNNEPEVYEKTYKFLTGSSYLTAKLTGRYVIDQFLAKGSFRPLYHQDGTINEEECRIFCRPDQICESLVSTAVAGYVTAKAAQETGLAEGTPVITGTGDSTSESISSGLTTPGTIFVQFGSSVYYYYCTDRSYRAYESPLGNGKIKDTKAFTVPGTYVFGDGTNAAGTMTRWVRDVFYSEEVAKEKETGINAYTVMAQEAAEVAPGSEGLILLPYIYGERSPIQDPQATGLLFGLKGNHTRKHINRAALEGVAYSVYQHFVLFSEIGATPKEIVVAGGGTRNRTWMQIVCDMLGVNMILCEPYQCSCYGDAMMAAIGAGRLKDFNDLKNALPKAAVLTPNKENHELYAKLYPVYRDLYLDNKDKMHFVCKEV